LSCISEEWWNCKKSNIVFCWEIGYEGDIIQGRWLRATRLYGWIVNTPDSYSEVPRATQLGQSSNETCTHQSVSVQTARHREFDRHSIRLAADIF
jgi:hypothetical protein